MKSSTEPMQPENFYHVYNRGINRCDIFSARNNYFKFLEKYASHTESILNTYAYCLLKNHFHLLIKIKSEAEIRTQYSYLKTKTIEEIISNQFAHLFNGYAQYFNLCTHRTGKLFDLPFRRKQVSSDDYLSKLIFYIHSNPQKHRLVESFKEYEFSSYNSHLSLSSTKLEREEVLNWFGGKEEYIKFHQQDINSFELPENLLLENEEKPFLI